MKNVPPGFKILLGISMIILGVGITAFSENYTTPILLISSIIALIGGMIGGYGVGEYLEDD